MHEPLRSLPPSASAARAPVRAGDGAPRPSCAPARAPRRVARFDDQRIHRNLIAGNRLGGESGVLVIWGSHFNRIGANYIERAYQGDEAVYLGTSDHNQITGNVVFGEIRLVSGVGNLLIGNAVTNHGGDGILVEGAANKTTLLRNLATGNGDDGLDVEDPSAQIVGNTASGNGDYGIEAVPGVHGGANRASDNANPEQCLEIACK